MKNIFLLVPVYNENKYIEKFLQSVLVRGKKIAEISRIVVINDGSTDNSLEIVRRVSARNHKLIPLSHKGNMGKGAAMRTGLEYAKKHHAEAVIFMDGDMQHDPGELGSFVDKLQAYPVVFGYRYEPVNMPFMRKLGNRVFGLLIQALFGTQRKDLLCGFLAVRNDVFDRLTWSSHRYGVEMEIALMVHKLKINFKEIPVKTTYFDPGKGMTFVDGLKILFSIPSWELHTRKD